MAQQGLPHHWDASGGLHVNCTEGELWTLLSGQPDSIRTDQRPNAGLSPEWISITDLGAIWSPPLATSSVAKLLREEGLLHTVKGKTVPTEAAEGLYDEREAESTVRFPSKPGAIQRRWSYEVLERLRLRHDEVQAMRAERPPKPPPAPVRARLAVKWASTCQSCSAPLAAGDMATWDSGTRKLTCDACEANQPTE
jgi:hypothetical protein